VPVEVAGQWAVQQAAAVLPLLAQQPAVRRLDVRRLAVQRPVGRRPVVLEARAWPAVVRLPAEWLAGVRRAEAWLAARWDAVVDRVADCVADVRG
jgi:hypothetical protein